VYANGINSNTSVMTWLARSYVTCY